MSSWAVNKIVLVLYLQLTKNYVFRTSYCCHDDSRTMYVSVCVYVD